MFIKAIDDCEINDKFADILGHNDTKEVLGLLKNIKASYSPGPDGIYPRLLREAREEMGGVLTEIFVSCLAKGKVPEDWRMDSAVRQFKKGNKVKP